MRDETSNSHNRPDNSHKRKLSMNHVSVIRFEKCHHYLLEIMEDTNTLKAILRQFQMKPFTVRKYDHYHYHDHRRDKDLV